MAQRLIYIGPFGPFIFDDTDPQYEGAATTRQAIYTDYRVVASELEAEGDLYGNLQGFNEALKKSFLL